MDDSELWMSDGKEDDHAEEEQGLTGDPMFFKLGLEREGQSGGFHISSFSAEKQRHSVAAYDGGRSKKWPAFQLCCEAKAIIHGTLDSTSETPATLLIYEFTFFSYRHTRIKAANIRFKFIDKNGGSAHPNVEKIAPFARWAIMPSTEKETDTISVGGGVSGTPGITVNGTGNLTHADEKETTHFTEMIGANPPDDFENRIFATWSMQENDSQKSGIVSVFRACILLTRSNDKDEFLCLPSITAEPDFKTWLGTIGSSRRPENPIIFDPSYEPYNALKDGNKIDPSNLGAVNLDSLWSATLYQTVDGVKSSKLVVAAQPAVPAAAAGQSS